MGRFETRWLTAEKNLSASPIFPANGSTACMRRRPPKGVMLDMDSSVSPTHGEQEKSVWNGHYECTCYHPLFVFNQFGDLERCALRPGNVHSADGWEAVLKPVVARYKGQRLSHLFSRRRRLRQSRDLRLSRRRRHQIRHSPAGQPRPARKDRPFADAPRGAAAE